MGRNPELELNSLRINYASLARRVQALEEAVDVLATPIHRKCWFWLQGYRLWRVGRWWPSTHEPDLH